jgi:hypothetical protein
MKWDHFHCEYELDGEFGEIEGGWSGYPSETDDMNDDELKDWWYTTCVNWGMPKGAEIKHIWLAG